MRRTNTGTNGEVPPSVVLEWPDPGLPRLPRTFVPRRRLAEQLDRATRAPVTLLVAPAGAGKTLGVSAWLQGVRGLGADVPPPELAEATWVHSDRTWDVARVRQLLDSAADRDGPPRLVVVDDAHDLPPSALRLIDQRLTATPQSLRVLLLSRWDLALTRFVPELLGHITVLRGDVLRMDREEAAVLIADHARTTSIEVFEAINDQAQGWCAAIVLAARAVGAAPDPVAAARHFAQGDAKIADQVATEVFSTLQPIERHLLLCTAGEEVVAVSTAALLTNNSRAGEVLAGLEVTGLLVSRVGGNERPDAPETPRSPADARYRIHPLLAEVVRRRHAAGGVDVARARSTVARAVRLDLSRGDTTRAFDRLVAVHEPDLAAEVLATEGLRLVMGGQGPRIAAFVRQHGDVIDAHPTAWFAVALERWTVNDVEPALRWMHRLLDQADAADGTDNGVAGPGRAVVACIRLMRARLGLEPLAVAVGDGQRLVAELQEDPHLKGAEDAALPLLLVELGIGQNWLGDLVGAEASLNAAVSLGRFRDLPVVAAVAASHLAFTEYMSGREHACVQVATDALDTLAALTWRTPFTEDRARLALLLAELVDLPVTGGALTLPRGSVAVHAADLPTKFWLRLRDARLQLMSGSVAAAEQTLATPLELPVAGPLPSHLAVVLLVEKAFLAALASDAATLAGVELGLRALVADGEAALAAGLRADLAGDRRAAAENLAVAAETAAYDQPASRALALTCLAQVLDALGESETALNRLREATAATEVRRNAVPFLGWSRQGTPIATLLERLNRRGEIAYAGWAAELASALVGRPDIAALFAPTTATARERTSDVTDLVQPRLSPREREVLNELARGATYADIAARLFVSENTVKTHVSSLYGKLAASRRSEALLAARNLNLL